LHIFSQDDSEAESPASQAVENQATQLIKQLPLDTHHYLLDLFWKNYNMVIEVVPQEPFLEGYKQGGGQYYSVFLHLIILAMGVRFADKSRSDIGKLMLSRYDSTLHNMAKQLIEPALESGGLSVIQGFLLLSDLDTACGKDIVGWMHGGKLQGQTWRLQFRPKLSGAGMAFRLFFEMGLHHDGVALGLAERDIEVRRKIASACIIIDK
jgi:hypothetical protein